MNKRHLITTMAVLVLATSTAQTLAAENWWKKAVNVLSGSTENAALDQVDVGDISTAFKQALRIGSEAVVARLGGVDGFNADPAVHIPLPENLDRAKSMLSAIGMASVFDDLELRLNRAAEIATPIAQELFLQSINEMSFEDVTDIYQGPKDSATRYFRERMSPSLAEQMHPIVEESLSQAGAMQVLEQLLERYRAIPFAPAVDLDMPDYVVQKGLDGIFLYLAQEEAAIRENPVRQTTDLLKKVFGSN